MSADGDRSSKDMEATIRRLLAPGMGLLAADESLGTIARRFEQVGVESTEDTRRAYRELLFTAPGIGEQISGVILFDETIRQQAADGTPFPRLLEGRGAVPGIKVDFGARPLAFAPGESVIDGLDGLRDRLAEYRSLGARFSKWRAVLTIAQGTPSEYAIAVNAHALARFAALSQEAGLVPVVEPEVLMDGDHTIEQSGAATLTALRATFAELAAQRVDPEHLLLKPNMVLAGRDSPTQPSIEESATATLRCLRAVVPPAVPGIVFLSGGQSPELATARLSAMNTARPQPWVLTFSYSRAIQDPVLAAWRGEPDNVPAAQEAFANRARLNSLARMGRYQAEAKR